MEFDLESLLARVQHNPRVNAVEGLDAFRRLLESDPDGRVRAFLEVALGRLEGRRRGGIAFALAEHHLRTRSLGPIRELFAIPDDEVRVMVLNALWSDPGPDPLLRAGVLELALRGAEHPAPAVRAEACRVVQNQAAWGVDVGPAVAPLLRLLSDPDPVVRQAAAHATGNLGKRRFDGSSHIEVLAGLLDDADPHVPGAAAWALAKLARARHDIAPAVPGLVRMLNSGGDYEEPRKRAADALLHHARRAPEARERVRDAVATTPPDASRKEVATFLDRLAAL